jgi:hypothetical protein
MKLIGIGRSLDGPIMIMPNWFREKELPGEWRVPPPRAIGMPCLN